MGETYTTAESIPLFRFWCQKILPAVYDDSLSYYELLNKVVQKLNEMIKTLNEYGDATNASVQAVIEIRDNLSKYIVKAINEDEETKAAIDDAIRIYMQTPYKDFEAMASEDHIEGEVCITRGYYEAGDGGEGIYIVTSDFIPGHYGEDHYGVIFTSVSRDIKLSEWGILPGRDITSRFNEIVENMDADAYRGVKMDSVCLNFGSGIFTVSAPLSKLPGGCIVKGTNLPTPYQRMTSDDTLSGEDYSGGTTLLFTSTQSGATCMRTSWRTRVEGIMFVSMGSYTYENNSKADSSSAGFTYHPNTTQYEPLVETVLHEVNGLDMSMKESGAATNCYVSNCSFIGFGGYALKPSSHAIISDCAFTKNHVGIMGADAQLTTNCYFSNGGYGIVSPNVRLANCWFDAFVHHAVFSGNPIAGSPSQASNDERTASITGEITGCTFDHIQYSAIRAASCGFHGLLVNATFTRCGFYRAGLKVDDAIAELDACDSIAAFDRKVDGMCAVNIPIANNLILKGGIMPTNFVDGTTYGVYSCPQFAVNARNFRNGLVECIPYNISGTSKSGTVYQLEPCYWWTPEGFQNTTLVPATDNSNISYWWGTVDTFKNRYSTNHIQGYHSDSVTGFGLRFKGDAVMFNSPAKTAFTSGQTYSMDTLPGYFAQTFQIPVYSIQGFAGYIQIPSGRNVTPVFRCLANVAMNVSMFANSPIPLGNLEGRV